MSESYECPVCYDKDKANGFVTPKCDHLICLKCYTKIIKLKNSASCPCCRKEYIIQEDDIIEPNANTGTGTSRHILDMLIQSSILSRQRIVVARSHVIAEFNVVPRTTVVLPDYVPLSFFNPIYELDLEGVD